MWLVLVSSIVAVGAAQPADSPRTGWDFAFKDFVIAAWCPPDPTDAQYAVYREAGFNVVMGPRYKLPDKALELAEKHGLKLLIDTFRPARPPWGNMPELRRLHQRYGRHPALAGYLLGDDQGDLPPELVSTTRFLRENAPHLFPWICQNVHRPKSLVEAGNPIGNLQIYPMLRYRGSPARAQAYRFCEQLERCRQDYRRHDLIMWPMFNVCGVPSDSLVRFQVYASVAYGAQGIWYFTYYMNPKNKLGAALQDARDCTTVAQVRAALRPAWQVARDVNHRVAAWGPRLVGRTCCGVFYTGKPDIRALRPAPGQLVEHAGDDLLVGILTKPGATPLAMVVDRRVHNDPGAIPERDVTVRFAPAVAAIDVLDGKTPRSCTGPNVTLRLRGGEGRLLALAGKGLDKLCPVVPYEPPPEAPFKQFADRCQPSRKPTVPAQCVGRSAADWVDVQDAKFSTARPGRWSGFRPDPDASDGCVAWMPGTHNEWAIQYNCEAPALSKGRWRVYAVVKAELGADKGPVLAMGLYDVARKRPVTAIEVSSAAGPAGIPDGKYRTYDLGVHKLHRKMQVWLAPRHVERHGNSFRPWSRTRPPADTVRGVWVDRLFFVRN
jgi:hypothetical protein